MAMRITLILVAVLLIGVISSPCMAEIYTQKTGPFTIQVTSEEAVEFIDIIDPYPVDNFNAYDVNFDVGDKHWEIEIQDYGRSINIESLMPSILNFFPTWIGYYTSWETADVGGKPGLIGIRENGGTDKNGVKIDRGFVAAYSPDGFGNQGTIIAIMDIIATADSFKEDKAKFESVVKDIRISKTV